MIARVLLATVALGCALPAHAVVVSQVRHDAQGFDPAHGESAQIHFRLSGEAPSALWIYDGRDLRIRTIDLGVLAAGEHVARWDGRDDRGRPVPPEAYTYAISAASANEPALWDLGAKTGGDVISVFDVRWDAQDGRVHYRIEEPARVRIRIGLENDGPLLRTLIDWVPRASGEHAEPWDGKDAAGVFDLKAHPKLELAADAFALPRNTLLVLPSPARVQLIAGLPKDTPRRERPALAKHRMFDFANQPIETRRDFAVELVPVGDVPRTRDGAPLVQGPVVVQLRAGDDDLASILSERCEAVFYVDGQFVFEREIGFLPMTWTWTPTATSPGTHYITANVRGYEGHFGMTTLRLVLGAEGSE
jgi:hypothetical protein